MNSVSRPQPPFSDTSCEKVLLGVLGQDSVSYAMPLRIFRLVTNLLGTQPCTDFPPFLAACLDGILLVSTVRHGPEYMSAAFLLTAPHMREMAPDLFMLWETLPKDQTVEDFFAGTSFKLPLLDSTWLKTLS